MKRKTFYLFCIIFFTSPLTGQNNPTFHQDNTSISLGTFFTTNNSISGIIQAEQVLIKNRNTSYHVFGGWNFSWYFDRTLNENSLDFSAQAYFGGFTIAERIKKNKFIFISIGTNYSYERVHAGSTARKQNFYPLVHMGYKKIWEKYLFKFFLVSNSDIDYKRYTPSLTTKVGEDVVPKKWYFGLGISFGRHFF